MKKAKTAIKTVTAEAIEAYKLTASDREDLKRLAAMPDDRIDTSDIPDSGGSKGWSRMPASRPATRQIAAAETW